MTPVITPCLDLLAKALILAAGLGSRLEKSTADRPKALVQVRGRPILSYQLSALRDNAITDVGIVLGYEGRSLVEYVEREFPDLQVRYFWNRDYATTNSSYSFWMAYDWIRESAYVHLNCDIIFSPSLLAKVIESRRTNLIAIRTDVEPRDGMENVAVEGGRITKMSINRFDQSVGKAFGLAKFGTDSTEFLAGLMRGWLREGDRNQHYYGLIRRAAQELDYYALDATDDLLLEVNTLSDLADAEQALEGM